MVSLTRYACYAFLQAELITRTTMTRKHHLSSKHRFKQAFKRLIRPWHRWLGIFSAIFVLLLAITGILINHSNPLSIDSAHVKQVWLLDYYGIKTPEQISIYLTSPHILASSNNLVWVDSHLVLESDSAIKGMVHFGEMVIAIDSNALYLISNEGALLETQDINTGLPAKLTAIANDGQLWINTNRGSYVADEELIEWTAANSFAPLPWAKPLTETVNPAVTTSRQAISLLARSHNLTWERVLLDIHSGRFFGSLGPWFMDLVALTLIIMSLSGVYLWMQHRPKRIKRR